MSLRDSLIEYVQSNVAARPSQLRVDEDTPLIERGLIDSIGLMQLVALIEQQTGLQVPDDEITPQNFGSIASIEAMVLHLEAARSGR